MERYAPDHLEGADRATLARAIFREVSEGRGTASGGVYLDAVERANSMTVGTRMSLDIPTGIGSDSAQPFFNADVVCTLAAPKKVLFNPRLNAEVYVADLGIPKAVYQHFKVSFDLPFEQSALLRLV